jgi:hypothetical protein
LVFEPVQVRCIALFKLAVRETLFFGALVPGLDEVLGDIDAQDVRSKPRLW